MSCKECLPLLELHLDGELDRPIVERLNAHLQACAACASASEELRREQDFYASYECGATPAPSFWANVSARIEREQETRDINALANLRRSISAAFGVFSTPRLSLALTLLLVASAVGLTALVMRDKRSSQPVSDRVVNNDEGAHRASTQANAAVEPSGAKVKDEVSNRATTAQDAAHDVIDNSPVRNGSTFVPAAVNRARRQSSAPHARHAQTTNELVRQAEQKYVAAIALLSRDVSRRRTRLDAATIAQFKQTLDAVDRTIAGTRRAVHEHPEDTVAVQYMLTAYAKKVEVLREMVNQ